MDKQPVGQLPDLTQSNNDDEIMVITNSEYNQLKKEKISDFITDLTSTDENNAIVKGTDGKLFTKDFGNASNITEGTLPTSVLPTIPLDKIPDIPKSKLPVIETTDLPASGVTADTYAYPSSVTVNAQGQVTAIEEGTPSGSNANTDLSNITEAGKEVIKENSGGSGLEVGDIGMALYVDETKGLRRRLNGTTVSVNTNTQAFVNKLKSIVALYPSLACTEEEWQAAKTASAFGQVGKFVIDDEAGTVRLPAVVNVQGLIDLQNLGVTVAAGLPNITGTSNGYCTAQTSNGSDVSGCIYNIPLSVIQGATNNAGWSAKFGIDASLSNSIYGNSTTVQPEAIQYPYFIQIATGQETEVNITNEIELNNPFFFGMSQYFDVEPNNVSWLKSAGQWNSKAVYPDYYNWLLQEKNNPSTLPADTANVEITGSLTNNNGVLSGFSESNYALVPDIPSNIESLEIVFKYTTTDDVTTRQTVYGQNIVNKTAPQLAIGVGSGLSQSLLSLDADNWGTGIYTLETPVANTTYTAKTTWDNVSKTQKFFLAVNNGDFVEQGSVSQETVYWVEQLKIGLDINIETWLGSIDLNGCYININGSRWWSGMSNGVKLSTEEYTDYDFVINTTNETFRLPLKNGMEGVFAGQAVVGNGMTLGLSDNSINYGLTDLNYHAGVTDAGTLLAATTYYGLPAGSPGGFSAPGPSAVTLGIPKDPAKSGLVVSGAGEVPDGFALYYYVGETAQNANLIDAGRIGELVSTKANIDLSNCTRPYVTETYANGTSWYRVYSDGWCEQGGVIGLTSGSWASVSKTFLKQYKDTNYLVACIGNWSNAESSSCTVTAKSMSGFTVTYAINTTAQLGWWQACGYIN